LPADTLVAYTSQSLPPCVRLLGRGKIDMIDNPLPTLNIRPWSKDDLSLLERLMGDPVMTEHLGGPENLDQIRSRHERYCRIGDAGSMFVIVVGTDNAAAGSVGYWEKEWQGRHVWEIGWSVLPEFQGQGIGTRATMLAVDHARSRKKHRFIHAYPSVNNLPSNAICRKVGFKLQGAYDFEYPKGHFMLCNDWCLDLFSGPAENLDTDP
jgi:RimJ/RimL family protein N-acetyltransferase